MKTELKRFLGSGFALLMLVAVPLDLRVAWRSTGAQQNSPSPGTISTNPEAALAERDWDSALANALSAAHNLSDARQNGSGSATIKDLQSKYEQAVKAANDAWDRFQSCLPQSQRCLLNSDLTLQASPETNAPTKSPADHPPTDTSNSTNSSKKDADSSSPPGSSVEKDDDLENCDCELLRWAAERAQADADDAYFYDSSYEQRYGHRDPGLASRADTAKANARVAWAKYRACRTKLDCPSSHSSAAPEQQGFLGLFQFFFGVLGVDGPSLQGSPPPANLFDGPSLLQDLEGEEDKHPDAPGHFSRDEFGNLTIECDKDGCSAKEAPLQLTPNSATEPAKPPVVQPSTSGAPRTEEMIRADIQYHIMDNSRRHGLINFKVHVIGQPLFSTNPVVYERNAQANDSNYSYSITLPSGQAYGVTLAGATPPDPRALAIAALNGLDWSKSRRRLSMADGLNRSAASPDPEVPGEMALGELILTGLTRDFAKNVAENAPLEAPSQMVVVGDASAGSSVRPATASDRNFVLATYHFNGAFGAPPPRNADSPSTTVYSIVANGKSSGQALELQVSDTTGKLRRATVPPGTVLEPVKQGSAKPVAGHVARGAALIKQPLNAYCLEFSKLPPDEGMLYRIAPQSVQDKFKSTRSVLRAAHQLSVDDDTTQYSVWSAVGNWDEQQFGQRFVEHSKKNAEAMNVKWTPQFESAVRAVVPERWRLVSLVLQEAAKP